MKNLKAPTFLIIALAALLCEVPARASVSCQATCQATSVYSLLNHAYDITGATFDAFKAACTSQGGATTYGEVMYSCGSSRDVWCWDIHPKTLTASGSGYANTEYEARVAAQTDCISRLPARADCTTYVSVGSRSIVSVTCR